jgi:hypothetical protein
MDSRSSTTPHEHELANSIFRTLMNQGQKGNNDNSQILCSGFRTLLNSQCYSMLKFRNKFFVILGVCRSQVKYMLLNANAGLGKNQDKMILLFYRNSSILNSCMKKMGDENRIQASKVTSFPSTMQCIHQGSTF